MAKVVKCCHQVTWAQKKHDQREREQIFNFKIFKYE